VGLCVCVCEGALSSDCVALCVSVSVSVPVTVLVPVCPTVSLTMPNDCVANYAQRLCR
jgi:Ni,Fe-hydrogenase III small subunit